MRRLLRNIEIKTEHIRTHAITIKPSQEFSFKIRKFRPSVSFSVNIPMPLANIEFLAKCSVVRFL